MFSTRTKQKAYMCCFSKSPRVRRVFGVALVDAYRSAEYQFVPKIVVKCAAIIERSDNIGTVGIYRIAADDVRIHALQRKVRLKLNHKSHI